MNGENSNRMSANLGKPVEISQISRELKKLWEADEAATNASLMNLVVYSERAGTLTENSRTVFDFTKDHACRAILVEMQRDTSELSAEAWITAHCHLAGGSKTVCCEQISFLLKGRAIGRLRNTLFANLNSDLPLVFWWQGELSDLFEERLYKHTDRFLFDSSDWSNAVTGYKQITQALSETQGQLVVQDMEWTRTFGYRLALAGLFDDPVAKGAGLFNG